MSTHIAAFTAHHLQIHHCPADQRAALSELLADYDNADPDGTVTLDSTYAAEGAPYDWTYRQAIRLYFAAPDVMFQAWAEPTPGHDGYVIRYAHGVLFRGMCDKAGQVILPASALAELAVSLDLHDVDYAREQLAALTGSRFLEEFTNAAALRAR